MVRDREPEPEGVGTRRAPDEKVAEQGVLAPGHVGRPAPTLEDRGGASVSGPRPAKRDLHRDAAVGPGMNASTRPARTRN